jgi:UDP-N-acetylglucosamine:LPS N-acetylglucosamine transferase
VLLETGGARARLGAARVIDPARETGEALFEALDALLASPAQLQAMGAAAARLARPGAAEAILAECRDLAGGGKAA